MTDFRSMDTRLTGIEQAIKNATKGIENVRTELALQKAVREIKPFDHPDNVVQRIKAAFAGKSFDYVNQFEITANVEHNAYIHIQIKSEVLCPISFYPEWDEWQALRHAGYSFYAVYPYADNITIIYRLEKNFTGDKE